jgi:cell division transport system permease protein
MEKMRSALKPRPNYVATIVSVSLVLFLLGIFAFISLHANVLGDYFKERINVIAELKPKTSEKEIARIQEQLATYAEIKAESITHVSKAEAAEILAREFGEDVLLSDMPSPLYDVITFNVRSDFLTKESLLMLKNDLKRKYSAISDIFYQETLLDTVLENIRRISVFVLALSGLVAFIALLLIFNAIRVALYANRFLIKNMEMVGASRAFIQKPFLLKALQHGFISAVLALLLLAGLLTYFVKAQPDVWSFIRKEYLAMMAGGIILAGVLVTVISTWLVVANYLRKPVDELF